MVRRVLTYTSSGFILKWPLPGPGKPLLKKLSSITTQKVSRKYMFRSPKSIFPWRGPRARGLDLGGFVPP